MWRRIVDIRLIVVLVISLAAVGAFACGAAEEEADTSAPAPAASSSSSSAAPAAAEEEAPAAAAAPEATEEEAAPAAAAEPAAAEEAEPAPAPAAATTPAKPAASSDKDIYGRTSADFGGDWYVPAKITPGEVRSKIFSGPKPATYQENPKFAEMVAAGSLLPLAERSAVVDDRVIVDVQDEIGVYGGTWRAGLGGWVLDYGQWAYSHCTYHDNDQVTQVPWMCKDAEVSEDGTTWTHTMREGMRWYNPNSYDPATGVVHTIDHVSYAWDDLNFDIKKGDSVAWRARFPEVYKRWYPENQYHDSVTGELPDYTAIDDQTWSLTWTSPRWGFHNGAHQTKSTRCNNYCWTAQKFHLSKYHPMYGDHDQIEAWMEEGGFAAWTELHGHHVSVFSDVQTDVPWAGEAALTRGGSNDKPEAYLVANPFFYAFDPVGNQLPYYDAQHHIRFESQEVATFRAMAGESDGQGWGYTVNELPMYQSNMEKGDYSIYGWMGQGAKGIANFNQTYNEDAEIGRWIRTKEWRQAVAYAIDRDALNQTSNLGLGTIHTMVPHPSNIYYPGDEYTQLYTDYDPAKANTMLDALGITDTDGDGIRNRLDGDGNIELFAGTSTDLRRADRTDNPALIFQENLAGIGIGFDFKPDSQFQTTVRANKEYLTLSSGSPGDPYGVFPTYCGSNQAALIGCWYVSRGAGGGAETEFPPMMPGVADASYLPTAPADTWAADPTGGWKRIWDLHEEGIDYAPNDPRHIANGKAIFVEAVEQNYWITTVNFVPRTIFLKRNNFRNATQHCFCNYALGMQQQVYYFEDGIDNQNHPGNKSKRFKSESFLTGLTY